MYNPMTSFCSRQGGRHQSELLDFFTGMCNTELRKKVSSRTIQNVEVEITVNGCLSAEVSASLNRNRRVISLKIQRRGNYFSFPINFLDVGENYRKFSWLQICKWCRGLERFCCFCEGRLNQFYNCRLTDCFCNSRFNRFRIEMFNSLCYIFATRLRLDRRRTRGQDNRQQNNQYNYAGGFLHFIYFLI